MPTDDNKRPGPDDLDLVQPGPTVDEQPSPDRVRRFRQDEVASGVRKPAWWWRMHEPSARLLTRQIAFFAVLAAWFWALGTGKSEMDAALRPFVGLFAAAFFRRS